MLLLILSPFDIRKKGSLMAPQSSVREPSLRRNGWSNGLHNNWFRVNLTSQVLDTSVSVRCSALDRCYASDYLFLVSTDSRRLFSMERNKVAKFPILWVEQVNHIVRVHTMGFQTKRTKVSLDDFERGGNTLVPCLTNRESTLSEVSASAFVACGHDCYGRVATTLPSQLHCVIQKVECKIALSNVLRCINAVLEGEGSHSGFLNLTFTRGNAMTVSIVLNGVHSTFWAIVQVERVSVLNCYVVSGVFFTFSTTTNDESVAVYKAMVIQSEHTSSNGCTFQFIFEEVRDTTESPSYVFRHRSCSGVVYDSVFKVASNFLTCFNELISYFITNTVLFDSLSDIRDVVAVHELLNSVVHPTSRHGFSGIEVDNFRMLVDHCRTERVSQPFVFGGYYRRFTKHLSKFSFIWVEVGNEVGHIPNSTNDVIRAKGRTLIMRGCCTCSWHTYCH
nr:MAG TPA: hypothetical protein [Caudoviricetes sp.]